MGGGIKSNQILWSRMNVLRPWLQLLTSQLLSKRSSQLLKVKDLISLFKDCKRRIDDTYKIQQVTLS